MSEGISIVQIVTTAVAVFGGAVAGYQLYRTLWAPPDIRLFPGHQISVVCPPGEYPSFNIMLEFANFGARLGVLQFVERVRMPDKVSPLFEWFSPGPPKYRHGVTAPLLLLLPAV